MKLLIITFILLITFTACKKEVEETKQAEGKKMNHSGLMIRDPWIRPASVGTNTAFFGMIMNHTDANDTLLGASFDGAEVVEIHETYMKENDMMGMRRIDFAAVDANDSFELKPRSFHIMLIKLKENLAVGDKKSVTLNFQNAGEVKVEAEVRDIPNMGGMEHQH
ncbi:MAG: copper chaperone PCu(A)C [Ignavibacteria bacterium]|jgi:copper(I)-binding protein